MDYATNDSVNKWYPTRRDTRGRGEYGRGRRTKGRQFKRRCTSERGLWDKMWCTTFAEKLQKRLRISDTTIILLLSKRNQLKRYLWIQGSSHVYIVPLSMALWPVGLTCCLHRVPYRKGLYKGRGFSSFHAPLLILINPSYCNKRIIEYVYISIHYYIIMN